MNKDIDKKIKKDEINLSEGSNSSDESTDDEELEEIKKKMIPVHIRLRDSIRAKQNERKKGTKKYKENYDE